MKMVEAEDIYSDVDSEGFLEDMRSYGVAQALPLDVRPTAFQPNACSCGIAYNYRILQISVLQQMCGQYCFKYTALNLKTERLNQVNIHNSCVTC